jgi:hypothetical protein
MYNISCKLANRQSKTIPVAIIALSLLLLLMMICHSTKADDFIFDHGERSLPVWELGDTKASTVIVFIWARNCDECNAIFRNVIAPLYKRHLHEGHVDILITLIQYDEQVNNVMEYVCFGHDIYTSLVLASLSGEKDFYQKIITNPSYKHDDVCADKQSTSSTIQAFMNSISRHFNTSRLPLISIGGHAVGSDFSQLDHF